MKEKIKEVLFVSTAILIIGGLAFCTIAIIVVANGHKLPWQN